MDRPSESACGTPEAGRSCKDYIGPTPYGGGTLFWMDPKDPTLVHAEGTTFKVDFGRKTYTPLAIDYRRQNGDDPFTPGGHNLAVRQGRILYHDGKEYVVDREKKTVILQRKGDVYRPVAAFGNVVCWHLVMTEPQPLSGRASSTTLTRASFPIVSTAMRVITTAGPI